PAPDAAPGTPDAAPPPPPVDAAPPPPVDAAPPPPPVDAAPPLVDAAPPRPDAAPTCWEPAAPLPCGGRVLCAKKVTAVTIKAKVIYAKDLKAGQLDPACLFEAPGENGWQHGN